MTATATLTTTSSESSVAAPSLWRSGLSAGVVAGVATTAIAAVASALDVGVVSTDAHPIPVAGFAQLTVFFTVVGILIAKSMRRRAARPRATFQTTALALTAASFVPDVLLGTDVTSKLTLMLTHAVAAAIVIPVLVRRMPEHNAR
jgi:peptidoglycan/LPS O-acetylase OafA/YrhL